MAGKRDRKANGTTIVIRREEIVEGAHHGGAWKVAYADFVTAMMAFFLLMWLLNATTEDQRKGLADYFSPNNLMSHASSGTGQPFGGHTAYDEGALVSDRGSVQITEGKRPPLDEVEEGEAQVFTRARHPGNDNVTDPADVKSDPALTDPTQTGRIAQGGADGGAQDGPQGVGQPGDQPGRKQTGSQTRDQTGAPGDPRQMSIQGEQSSPGPSSREGREITAAEMLAEKDRLEKAAFEKAAEDIREAVRADPSLTDLAKQLSIDMTPEGLRIQIMDEIKLPMFASGSAVPNDRARELVRKVVPILQKLTQSISIAGHTDSAPFAGSGKTNWELSSERANATRRLLLEGGLADTRIRSVTGHADRDPLLPGDPLAAANRRIAILVLREARATPPADPGRAMPSADPGRAAPSAAPARPAPTNDPVRAIPISDPGRPGDAGRSGEMARTAPAVDLPRAAGITGPPRGVQNADAVRGNPARTALTAEPARTATTAELARAATIAETARAAATAEMARAAATADAAH